jgi:5-methyltetrahydropteroyltriglutamate--homocysteine methyltransferase
LSVIRAHVVGSMLRPAELLAARESVRGGDMSPVEFRAIEDRAVNAAIALQESAGIELITDGEQRRFDYLEGLVGTLDGLEQVPPNNVAPLQGFWHRDDPDYEPTPWIPPVVTSRIARKASLAGEEYSYTRARASRPVKVTLPSAASALAFYSPEHSTAAYPRPQELIADFAAVLHEEVEHLATLGCEYIQIDAPELTMLLEGGVPARYQSAGYSRAEWIDTELELLNDVTRVPGVTFGIHLCRGNKEGEWHSSGGYEAISSEIFPRLAGFDHILLEFDDERSGGFEPLADIPEDKCVVLGLVSTKRRTVEDRGVLERRIDQAAEFYPRDQLAISPQCGFASISYGNPIPSQVEQAKLDLVGAIGREAWN